MFIKPFNEWSPESQRALFATAGILAGAVWTWLCFRGEEEDVLLRVGPFVLLRR